MTDKTTRLQTPPSIVWCHNCGRPVSGSSDDISPCGCNEPMTAEDVRGDPKTTPPVPIGESVLVWACACALAVKRHPHALTPELADVDDARTVLLGAVAIDRNKSPSHG